MERYWKVEMGNGFCGCDEQFLTVTEKNELNFFDCLDLYNYTDGVTGIDPESDEEFEDYSYEICIADDSHWEEITKEEFDKLFDEGWEIR